MSDNELIRRRDALSIHIDNMFIKCGEIYIGLHETIEAIENLPAVPQEMSAAEESRLRVSWRWLEDFAREYKSEQYAEFILAAKRAYVSSIEKMDGQWVQEHPETNMMTAKYALPRIDFKEGSDK